MSKLSTLDDNVVIGRRLGAARDRVRLSQNEFAERLGISPRAYQNYERGEREVPATVLRLLYEAFGIDPLWVLIGPGMDPSGADAPVPLDLVEQIVVAVESRLQRSHKQLPPEKKGRLVRLLYQHFRDKPQFDPAYVVDYLALAA